MKHQILVVLFVLSLSLVDFSFSQDNQPIVVSPLIGGKLDRVERNYFKLFPHLEGFEEAFFYMNPDSSLMVEIWYQTDEGIKDTIINRYRSVKNLQYHIDYIILHPVPPSRQAKDGAFTTISLADSSIVEGELVETGKYSLMVYNNKYRIPDALDLGSSGYLVANYNFIEEISIEDDSNIGPIILGTVGGIAGAVIGYDDEARGGAYGEGIGVWFGGMIGAAVGALLGYVIPIKIESSFTYKPPLSEKDIQGLRTYTKVN